MGQKIVIVGGVAGGASAAARLRRNSEEDRIIMFEKGAHVSFSNCALPYHLGGVIDKEEKLILMSPEKFLKQYRIEAHINNEVISIDREEKQVTVKNLTDDSYYKESYDKLILSPGATPVVPKIPGIEQMNVFTLRNVTDVGRIKRFADQSKQKEIVVIGGGFVGVEVVENFRKSGFSVTLVEGTRQILRNFDYDMVQILHKEMVDHGVNLIVEDHVAVFTKDKVRLASGREIEAAFAVMAVGVVPEVKLAKEAELEIGETGAIKTDKDYCTSDPDIYAVGDAIEVYHALTQTMTKLSLAGPALKQARAVADHIHQKSTVNKGYIGASAIKVFDLNGASVGVNESMVKSMERPVNYDIVRLSLSDKVGIMPDAAMMHFKLLFEVPTGRVLGAQAIGKGDVTKRIDVIATCIKFGGTLEDLKDLELCYAPPFSTAKDIVNYAGYTGTNLLSKAFRQVNVDRVRELAENGSVIIDVRERAEYAPGHIKGARNIPLSELRDRMAEIPKDKPVYLHCRTGQRSYNAVMLLQNSGYEQVVNIAGSFMGVSLYEYYNDKRLKREPIVTAYNFN